MTRVTTDVDAVNELFTSGVVTVFGDLFTLFGIMGVMLAMNWKLALVTFSVIPLFFVVTNWFRRGARATFREVRRWVARINAFLQENLTGMAVVQLFRREERNREAFAAINRAHTDANLARSSITRSSTRPSSSWPPWPPPSSCSTAGGASLAGTLTLGALVAFIQYSERFWRPISDLSEKFNILQAAMASSERIFTLLDTEPKVVAPARPVHLEKVRGRVGFEGVTFGYQPETPVLQDIDFAVEPGKSVALVGATGAGKTSIISLLTRFYDVQQGRVTLDGVDVRELDPAQLRSLAGPRAAGRAPLLAAPSPPTSGSAPPIPDERVREAAPRRARASLHRGAAAGIRHRGARARGHALRRARSSSSPSRARWPTIRASSSSTRRPRPSTRRRRPSSRTRCGCSCTGAPPS